MPKGEPDPEPTICPKCGSADVRYRAACSEPGLFLVCLSCDYNEEFTERPAFRRSGFVTPSQAIRGVSVPMDDLLVETVDEEPRWR